MNFESWAALSAGAAASLGAVLSYRSSVRTLRIQEIAEARAGDHRTLQVEADAYQRARELWESVIDRYNEDLATVRRELAEEERQNAVLRAQMRKVEARMTRMNKHVDDCMSKLRAAGVAVDLPRFEDEDG